MDFRGKKITLMGLGLLGRGIGDARFLAAAGADLIVTDLKTEAELAPAMEQLREFPDIVYHLGGHRLEDFEGRDMILRAPNAPLDSPFLARARKLGIPVEMDASLFVRLAFGSAPSARPAIVGITGTRGKSTTTHLIYEMLRAAGKRTHLGGNERDTATLPLIDQVGRGDLVVLELDSWQLQGFEEDRISPNLAVWTNFLPDHMNYYHGDMDRYFRDKAAIARFQKAGDAFIAPRGIREKIEARFGPLAGRYAEPAAPDADWEIALPGDHNRANAACAVAAAREFGVPEAAMKTVLRTFAGLPGRLEPLGEKRNIEFYNDSNATTPEAAVAALRALAAKHKPIVLIAGGNDKELEFAAFAREVQRSVKYLVLFEGKASEKIKALLPEDFPVAMAPSMRTALDAALAAGIGGPSAPGIILLSPGATSFGIFRNEYDRGDQFRALVAAER
ncbi:MAG TPA: UDP-N-acetylmuramoyl-L-alanine--D-glutamate ligase [Candidatus Paceibacterota bacterium]|nr:UDP-N-acetylmuramoyl-L-alanine--D-glutamate ligase [Candidatus Paceibacterota bacterium]